MQVLCIYAKELFVYKLFLLRNICTIRKNSLPSSQGKYCVFVTKSNRLMLFRKVMAIYSENCTDTSVHFVGKMLKFLELKQLTT
jgi:hypothetical protein